MNIIQDPLLLQNELLKLKRRGKKIGFVPTMGNLHEGHLSLVELARQHSDIVVSSIFVNPMQFGPNEDYDNYPRTLEADKSKLKQYNVDFLFTPTNEIIYPFGKEQHTSVQLNRLTNKLCGAKRPGHFKGVTTVVNIFFNIVQPDIAVFGKKDYQQFLIIQSMVSDLMMPIKIIGAEIKREKNGLALSSRNQYLTEAQKDSASLLQQTIKEIAENIKQGDRAYSELIERAKHTLLSYNFKVDYLEIVKQSDLEAASPSDNSILIAVAAWYGSPRLIDNLEINL
ncbi:pantoate--beta-alanine ligase [Aliikangiella sp. IMCC44359]|uniref:pantoate--beta-alanine ligase n=1 Tax=Aliikangiella sp. IMCC44359 TaxID=3459125 RepID=UPI00403AD96D